MAQDTSSSTLHHTRFERARIIGARALQVAMGAPVILEERMSLVDPVRVAELEYERALIPITVARSAAEKRPTPRLVYYAPAPEE